MSDIIEYDHFVDKLLTVVPELIAVKIDHLKNNDELLPHVFLGAVTRFAIRAFRDSKDETLYRLLGFMEQSLASSDPRVLELVTVSFFENLHQAGSDMKALREHLGPRSKKCLDELS